jgi:YVTN family beta-propeller protein
MDQAPPSGPPRQSQSLALSADGSVLAVVNTDSDSLSVIDTTTRQLRQEIYLGSGPPQMDQNGRYVPAFGPRSVDLSSNGQLAYVACQESGQLVTVDLGSGKVAQTLPLGAEPVGVLLNPAAQAVYVSLYQSGQVVRLPLDSSGMPQASAAITQTTTDRPWGLALDGAGSTLYVTRFLLNPGLDLFDPSTMAPQTQAAFADVAPRGDPLLAHGVVRGLYSAVVRPGQSASNAQVWVAHMLLGTDTAQPTLDFQRTVFPAVSIRDGQGNAVGVLSVNADEPGVNGAFGDVVSGPRALAFTPDGGLLLMLDMSSEDVLVINPDTQVEADLVRPLPGELPQGIVISPDGLFAYVDERASLDVAVLSIAPNWRTLQTGLVTVNGPVISRTQAADPMPAQMRLGQRLFYSANSSEFPITQNFWVSCASCHLEARSDAVVWLFAPGPRDTPSNAGGVLETGFLMHNALRNVISQYDETIQTEMGGDMDSTRPADLALLNALTEYVNYAIPFPHSPELDPTTQQPSAAAQRGSALFQQYGCPACHFGPRLTDSGSGNPTLDLSGTAGPVLLHDVGTCVTMPYPDVSVDAYNGTSRPACQFDTPGLVGVFDSAPYFHDGSAATLDDVVDHFVQFLNINPAPTSQQHSDLVAYLRSL